MVWYGMVWYGMVWYGIVEFNVPVVTVYCHFGDGNSLRFKSGMRNGRTTFSKRLESVVSCFGIFVEHVYVSNSDPQ